MPRLRVAILASKSPAQRTADVAKALQELPVRHAVIRLDVGDGYLIEVSPMEFGDLPDPKAFLPVVTDGATVPAEDIVRANLATSLIGAGAMTTEEVDADGNL